MSIIFEIASTANVSSLVDFLQKLKLPNSDLPADLSGFTIAVDGTQIVGSAGMELLGNVGLLRSVAVAETHRNQQLGQRLFTAALDHARSHQVQEVFLITNTADQYFAKNGFQPVDRSAVPDEIAQTAQFSSLCPSTAVIMKLELDAGA